MFIPILLSTVVDKFTGDQKASIPKSVAIRGKRLMDGSGLESGLSQDNEKEILNVVQVESGQAVEINPERDKLLTEFGKSTLIDRCAKRDSFTG